MAQPRPSLNTNSTVNVSAGSVSPSRVPAVGLVPFEASPTHVHPGTQIFRLEEVTGKTEQEIFDVVRGLDDRALVDMPQELLDEIRAGNIEHIFQTNPETTTAFNNLSAAEQQRLRSEQRGSVYFRTKDGRTTRFKLPEIATNDAGWNANKGGNIFMDAAVYGTEDEIRSINEAVNVRKMVDKGTVPETYKYGDDVANINPVGDVLSGSPTVGTVSTSTARASTPPPTGAPTASAPESPATAAPAQNTRVSEKGPIINVGEQTEMKGPTTRPKVKPDTTPSARVSATSRQTPTGATQRPTVSRATRRGVADGASASAAVASGVKGSNNLRIAGAGAILGVAGYGISRLRGKNRDDAEYARMVEMQRHYRR